MVEFVELRAHTKFMFGRREFKQSKAKATKLKWDVRENWNKKKKENENSKENLRNEKKDYNSKKRVSNEVINVHASMEQMLEVFASQGRNEKEREREKFWVNQTLEFLKWEWKNKKR